MGKLLFFDVDGTLVDFGGQMSSSTIEALHKVRENGHKIFVCTGRSRDQVYSFLSDFGFDGFVCAAGGYVEYEGRVIFNEVFGKEKVQGVVDFARKSGAAMILQDKSKCITTKKWHNIFGNMFRDARGDIDEDETFSNHLIDEELDEYPNRYQSVESLVYCNSKYNLEEVAELLPEGLKVTASSFKEPSEYMGEITISYINKAVGIQKLLDEFNMTVDDVIAFGDGPNDLDMLEFAGIGVAMGNACEQAKLASDIITDDVDNDGIYNACKKLGIF